MDLDIGEQRIHVHGHGWPATDNIAEWKWISNVQKMCGKAWIFLLMKGLRMANIIICHLFNFLSINEKLSD